MSSNSQQLSLFQKKLLTQTWPHVLKTGQGIGHITFHKLLQKQPEFRNLFARVSAVNVFSGDSAGSLESHEKLLNDLLDQAINNLDDLSAVGERCTDIGQQHAQLSGQGFNAATWDTLGEILLEAITQLDIVRKHRELVRGWTMIISFITDRLRNGYRQGIRKQAKLRQGTELEQQPVAKDGADDGDS